MAASFVSRSVFLRGPMLILSMALSIICAGNAASETGGAPTEVGTALLIKRTVTGTLGEEKRELKEGGRVHRDEYLETGKDSRAELKLDDQTKLALGPSAGLKLDTFVLGDSSSAASIGLNFVKGTFRFITGDQKKESYRIETPSATIGVRGTVFDVYVDERGETLILLHEGEVDICSRARTRRRHNSIGRIVHVTVAGLLSDPIKFTKGLIPGVTVARAFPFVGRELIIDPLKRLDAREIVEPADKATRALREGTQPIERAIRRALPF